MELNVKEKMKISDELRAFVKHSRTSLKDQLVLVPDLLECLDGKIKSLYAQRREENLPDEFDYSYGISGEEQIFYTRYFALTAMLKTYMNLHTSSGISECILDLFKIGGNSSTSGLFPEVNGICTLCADQFFDAYSSPRAEDVESVNKLVIKKQFEHRFYNPKFSEVETTKVKYSDIQLKEDQMRKLRVDHAKVKVEIHQMNDKLDEAIKNKEFLMAEKIRKDISVLKERRDDLYSDIDSDFGGTAADASNINVQNIDVEVTTDLQVIVEKNMKVSFNEEDSETLNDDSSDIIIFNPFSAGDGDFKICNPFAAKSRPFSCDLCFKTFSDAIFVEMHITNFHSQPKKTPPTRSIVKQLKLKYVESADTSIQSYKSKDKKKKVQNKSGKAYV